MERKVNNPRHYYLNRQLKSIRNEKWKEIVGFEGLYEISDYGRVKSLAKLREVVIPKRGTRRYWVKEIILKQIVGKSENRFIGETSFHLKVSLYKDGIYTACMVSRLVYAHFGTKSSTLSSDELIFHKDNDGLYNRFSNLYVGTHQEMTETSFKRKRRDSFFTHVSTEERKRYSLAGVAGHLLAVTQYAIDGRRVACYKSILEAAQKTGANDSTISSVLKGRYLTAGGYIWRKGKGRAVINVAAIQKKLNSRFKHKCKKIIQYTVAGKKVKQFNSIAEAAEAVNGNRRQLQDALHGRSQTAYKHVWRFV